MVLAAVTTAALLARIVCAAAWLHVAQRVHPRPTDGECVCLLVCACADGREVAQLRAVVATRDAAVHDAQAALAAARNDIAADIAKACETHSAAIMVERDELRLQLALCFGKQRCWRVSVYLPSLALLSPNSLLLSYCIFIFQRLLHVPPPRC